MRDRMAAMFTFVLASALYRDLDISCGCFSASGGTIGYVTLIRAIVILLASLGAYATVIFWPRPQAPKEHLSRNVVPAT